MMSNNPILGLDKIQGLHLAINNALILGPLIRLHPIKRNDTPLPQAHNNLTIFSGFIQQNTSRNAIQSNLLERL
jgi:hypothetical protein